ncbi:PepSY-associated TM helix domain-containing protein [Paucibacter sp. TC2R-5]|uniref:PepSY-associated TM helix domain-containing protein n=1 Tax=Paucibacter sp. TC2R-5 TaxID=2893555 RepID=UPI0021E3ADFB|nr:PepSY-associated TM helix domain-containing protein [Paucibacter sp. TC2R-5]MCV2358966.1 PepSY-associated TM helix domain-containing protein [Paucibacter sp. TC2R-5]
MSNASAYIATDAAASKTQLKSRAAYLKQLHLWHWVSSAISLVALLMFSVTGLTLNNAGLFESKARISSGQAQLPDAVLRATLVAAHSGAQKAELPPPLQHWLREQWGFKTAGLLAEWAPDELYLSLPRPGGDAWLRIALPSGEAEFERSERGGVAYLNDLHKGRHTGPVWSWFIDLFAVASLLFAITGLLILKMHAAKRPSVWPLVAAGLLLPVALLLIFVH